MLHADETLSNQCKSALNSLSLASERANNPTTFVFIDRDRERVGAIVLRSK